MREIKEDLDPKYGQKANEAYRTYVSIYFDFVDDSESHFTWRDNDIKGLKKIAELGMNAEDPELVYTAYMDEACSVAEHALDSGYFNSFGELFAEYPMLRDFSTRLEARYYGLSSTQMRDMAEEYFKLADWIKGTLSGGIEGCRIITEIESDMDEATISWRYPKTCGLSDRKYHNADPATVHKDKFTVEDNTLFVNGTIFDMDNDMPFKDLIMPMVYKFRVKWGFKAIKAAVKKEEEMTKKEMFEQKCYEAYKLFWLLQHGVTFLKIVSALADEDMIARDYDKYPEGNIFEIYEELVSRASKNGFGTGSSWACFDEFIENEFKDTDYMMRLLSLMPDSEELKAFYRRNFNENAAKMYVTDFCKFFDFSVREENGTNEDGDEYNYVATDNQGVFGNRYVKEISELTEKFSSLLPDYVDDELYGEGFIYTTSADEKLPTFYEQAKGWIEEHRNELVGSRVYKVICALISKGKTLVDDTEDLPFA